MFWQREIFSPPEKTTYTSGNRNPEKNFLYFLKKTVLIFQEMETSKKFLIFRETSYISGENFQSPKNQNLLYFSK